MRILMIGDIVGHPGRCVVAKVLEDLLEEEQIDFVIANGENVSHGKGITRENMLTLYDMGIDVITLGNHAFMKKDLFQYIHDYDTILRPFNLHPIFPGNGTGVYEVQGKKIRVTSLLGRVYMNQDVSNPFDALEKIIEADQSDIHIVDFHAEATGEKLALAWAFDGKVSAVLGTHTHVPTADARLLKEATAYISDVGMCGPYNGILGSSKKEVIGRTWTGYPYVFDIEDDDMYQFSAVLLTFDPTTCKCQGIRSILKRIPKSEV